MRATRFRRVALFAERPGGTGKKVKDREIDVAPRLFAGPCASKAANHWQATAPRRAPVAPRDREIDVGSGIAAGAKGILFDEYHNLGETAAQHRVYSIAQLRELLFE